MKNPAADPLSAGFSFAKRFRLLKPRDYQTVFDQPPLRSSHSQFLLLSKPNGLTQARIGLVVPKKAVKLAVDRNRIKRIVRDSFRHQKDKLQGLDIIFLAKAGLQKLAKPDFHQQLNGQWRNLMKRRQKYIQQNENLDPQP
jgi:ribonuclease P protein component